MNLRITKIEQVGIYRGKTRKEREREKECARAFKRAVGRWYTVRREREAYTYKRVCRRKARSEEEEKGEGEEEGGRGRREKERGRRNGRGSKECMGTRRKRADRDLPVPHSTNAKASSPDSSRLFEFRGHRPRLNTIKS